MSDQYELNAVRIEELHKIATFNNGTDATIIEIRGHTDNKGTHTYNPQLSSKRAEYVMTQLLLGLENGPGTFRVIGLANTNQ